MTTLREYHVQHGAQVAPDGIPLQYTDLAAEYDAALNAAILLDRSHEARLLLTGKDRFELPHRMSTNDLLTLAPNEGRATIFTSPNARILDRVLIYNRDEGALVVGGPGRGTAMRDYLQRHIFFRDDVHLTDLGNSTAQFSLHGVTTDAIIGTLVPEAAALPPLHGLETTIENIPVYLARRKPYSGSHCMVVCPLEKATTVWAAVLEAGKPHGLTAAGSLTFNTLRIRAGHPGTGRELSEEYIPLEVGLWDEVSFHKGCYTGQEIIARMESRNRLARTIVRVKMGQMIAAPAELRVNGKRAGTLTSSVQTPHGDLIGIAVVKVPHAVSGTRLDVENTWVEVVERVGAQPPMIEPELETAENAS